MADFEIPSQRGVETYLRRTQVDSGRVRSPSQLGRDLGGIFLADSGGPHNLFFR